MAETNDSSQSSILESLKIVIRNGVDYFTSSVALLQAQMTKMALSAVVFVVLLFFCGMLILGAFVLLTVAFGMWLSHLTGHVAWSLVILSAIYGLIAATAVGVAVRWANNIES